MSLWTSCRAILRFWKRITRRSEILFKWILLNWEYIRRFIYNVNSISFPIEYCFTYSSCPDCLSSYKTEKYLQMLENWKIYHREGGYFYTYILGTMFLRYFKGICGQYLKLMFTSKGHRILSVKQFSEKAQKCKWVTLNISRQDPEKGLLLIWEVWGLASEPVMPCNGSGGYLCNVWRAGILPISG